MDQTLYTRIRNHQELTDNEIAALVSVFGCGCHQKTKTRLGWALKAVPVVQSFGIYSRVEIETKPNGEVVAGYCAGQDYTSEVRTVRDLLLGRIS